MKLLAFETATEACSVALYCDGEIAERFEIAPRRHAELSLPWADALLAEAGIAKPQLDAIAFGRGPGAFTGVRLAIALSQGIALALDKPLVAVSTLEALATQAVSLSQDEHPQRILAAIDARMGEVYAGAFQREGDRLRPVAKEAVVAPEAYALPDAGTNAWIGVGTGFAANGGVLQTRLMDRFALIDAGRLPRASDVARLAVLAYRRGETMAPEQAEPAYLRDNVALTLEEQKALRASKNSAPG